MATRVPNGMKTSVVPGHDDAVAGGLEDASKAKRHVQVHLALGHALAGDSATIKPAVTRRR